MNFSIFPEILSLATSAGHAVQTAILDTENGGHRLVLSVENKAVSALHFGENELKGLFKEIGTKLGILTTEADDALQDAKSTIAGDVTKGETVATDLSQSAADLGAAAASASAAVTGQPTAESAPTGTGGTEGATSEPEGAPASTGEGTQTETGSAT